MVTAHRIIGGEEAGRALSRWRAEKDRLVPPEHVHKLWEHWERPRIAWYHGTHLSFHFDRDVRALMHDAYIESGLTVTGRD